MLFISDQHHMEDLENKVIRTYGKTQKIRLIGDMSPTNIRDRTSSNTETFLKKERKKKKKEQFTKTEYQSPEMQFEDKTTLDRTLIHECATDNFLNEWVCLYGGASISNLARKYFTNHFSSRKTLCLQGSEPIIDHVQTNIFSRQYQQEGIQQDEMIKYVWETIKKRKQKMAKIIIKQLAASGITRNITRFINSQLSLKNYGGQIPLSSSVFRNHPYLPKFQFQKKLHFKTDNKCNIIYIPYSYFPNERQQIDEQLPELIEFLEKKPKIPIIAYHANPYPQGMEDLVTKTRIDHNYAVARKVSRTVLEHSDILPHMICGHLHQENKEYKWTQELPDGNKPIIIHPLGIYQFAILDTSNGKIESKYY